MTRVGPASRMIVRCSKNFNVAIFSDAINVVNIKLFMMVMLIEVCLFIPLSVTLTMFQGHSSVRQFQVEILCSHPIKLKLCRIVKCIN